MNLKASSDPSMALCKIQNFINIIDCFTSICMEKSDNVLVMERKVRKLKEDILEGNPAAQW